MYSIVQEEYDNGDLDVLYVDIDYDDVSDFAEQTSAIMGSSDMVDQVSIIRGKTTRPMLKSDDGSKVYINENHESDELEGTNVIEISLSLSEEYVTDSIYEWLSEGQSTQQEPHGTEEQGTRDSPDPTPQGKVSFVPEYTKTEADYHQPGEGVNTEFQCSDCVHYASDNQCKMVQGSVDPNGHCEDLYTDIQINGRIDPAGFEANLIAWGDMFTERLGRITVSDMVESIRDALRRSI